MTKEEAQEKCQNNFINNLSYFKDNHPNLFEMITLFETAIAENMYQEKYNLEFTNNSFDIRVLEDNSLLYNKNLDSDAIQRVQDITMDEKKGFKTFKPRLVPSEYTINEDVSETHLEILYPLIEHVHKYSSKKLKMKKIEKFIFFGAFLGRHIELFVKTHSPKVILITEQDLEIFKLSLFVTDYSKIAQKTKIFFSITQDQEVFNNIIPYFLGEFEIYNYILKFDIFNHSYLDFIDTFLNYLSISRHTDWPFSADLLAIKREIRLINQGYNFIDFNKSYDIFSKQTPVIIVAPGPSMASRIQWLKENQDKFIIVSLGAAVQTLYKHNIKPDIITSVDPSMLIFNQFKGIPKEFLEDTIFIAASNTIDDVLNLFSKKNTYIYQVIFDMLGIGAFGGKSVGDVTLLLLLKLGVQELYLLGTDLCVNESGSQHVKEHQHYKELDKVETHNSLKNNFITESDLVEVKGNFREKVFTTRHFNRILYLYKQHIENCANENTKIFNLSDGSLIEGTISLEIEDIKIDNYTDKGITLIKLANTIIATDISVKTIANKIKLSEEVIELLYKYQKCDYNTYNNMMYDKFTVNIEILSLLKEGDGFAMLKHLAESFNNNVEGYINTFFNTKKNQVNKKRFNKLFQLWIKPQITIFEGYKKLLESIDTKYIK